MYSAIFVYCLSLFIFIGPIAAQAQADLLENPDISWVGEVFTDYRFSPTLPTKDSHEESYDWNSVAVEKLLSKPQSQGFAKCSNCTESFWQTIIGDWIFDVNKPAYLTANIEERLDEASRLSLINTVDTVIAYDAVTYKERLHVVRYELNPEDVVGARVRELFYYNKKQQAFGYKAVSFTPLLSYNFSEMGEKTDLTPLFWFPIHVAEQSSALWGSDDVTYIFETKTHESSPRINAFNNLKGKADFSKYIERIIKDEHAQLFSVEGDYNQLMEREKEIFSGSVDTVTTFDPITYEQSIRIIKISPIQEAIESIRFVVRWFVDDQSKQMYFQFNGFAPMLRVEGEKGELRYVRPAFYMKGVE